MDNTSHSPSRLEQILGTGVLLLLLIGCFLVMTPFMSALAWAFVMAFSLWPPRRRLVAMLGNRKTTAALIMTSAIALVLVVPTIVIVANLAQDVGDIGTAAKRWVEAGPPAAPAWLRKVPVVGNRAADYWQELVNDANALVRQA